MSRRHLVELALVVVIAVFANLLSARHYRRWDTTNAQVFSLSDKTLELAHGLRDNVKILVFFLPSGDERSVLYPYVRELLDRLAAASGRITIETIDLDRDLPRARAAAARYGVSDTDLADGVLVVESAGRHKVIRRDELGELDYSSASGMKLRRWTGERALVGALLALTEGTPPHLCFAAGHGEAPFDSWELGGAAELTDAAKHDQYDVKSFELIDRVPDDCQVVALVGPTERLAEAASRALAQHLERGRALLVLVGPKIDAPALRFTELGLEPLLKAWGVELGPGVVVDEPRLPGSSVAFLVTDGYREHAISKRLVGRRTIWADTRAVKPTGGPGLVASALITTGERGFVERSLDFLVQGPPAITFTDGKDEKGPITIATAVERTEGTGKGARLVVIGSVELALNRQLTTTHRDLLLSSLGWLAHSEPRLAIGAREPERFEIRLDAAQARRVFLVALVLLPLGALLAAAAIAWLRR